MVRLAIMSDEATAKTMDWTGIADTTTRWILTRLWDEDKGLFHPSAPPKEGELPYDFMWADGIAFSMLVGAARYNRPYYEPYLSSFLKGMDTHWAAWAKVPAYDAYFASHTGSDKYYDDNAWMVITFIEAFELTGEAKYLNRADEALQFVLSGWDDKLGGGIYWREDHKSKNTCSNGPSATGALAVARHMKRQEYIGWARRIVDWTRKTLQDPADGLYWDNHDIATDHIEKHKWTYNTALMLRSHLDLWRMTKSKADLDEAVRLAKASEKEFVNPETGAFRDEANFSHLLVEAYLDLYKETKEPWLKARAEANGVFAATKLKDDDGGYRTRWRLPNGEPEERKNLMANGSTGRLFWLLAEPE